jgi:hypothetical protein
MRVDASGAIEIRVPCSQSECIGGAVDTGAGDDLQGDASFAGAGQYGIRSTAKRLSPRLTPMSASGMQGPADSAAIIIQR